MAASPACRRPHLRRVVRGTATCTVEDAGGKALALLLHGLAPTETRSDRDRPAVKKMSATNHAALRRTRSMFGDASVEARAFRAAYWAETTPLLRQRFSV